MTNSSGTTASDFVVVSSGTGDFSGRISGNLNLFKTGQSSLTLRDLSDYTGTTTVLNNFLILTDQARLSNTSQLTVRNAVLRWDDSGMQAMGNRLPSDLPVRLDGGAFEYISRSGMAGAISIGGLDLQGGANLVRQSKSHPPSRCD